jgi:hypothetical protein
MVTRPRAAPAFPFAGWPIGIVEGRPHVGAGVPPHP